MNKKEMKKIVGGFKPEFSVSEAKEDHLRRPLKEIVACGSAYMLGICADPVLELITP